MEYMIAISNSGPDQDCKYDCICHPATSGIGMVWVSPLGLQDENDFREKLGDVLLLQRN